MNEKIYFESTFVAEHCGIQFEQVDYLEIYLFNL